MTDEEINRICDVVRQTSFEVHCYLKSGHLEKIYENSLSNRLRKIGMNIQQQHPMSVFDQDGTLLGNFFADLLVENALIVEIKAAKAIADDHVAQLLGYLRTTRIRTGLLINFGAHKLEVKKFLLD